MSYKIELVEKEDPIEQLEASKLSIKDLLSHLLDEIKGFKYQITLNVICRKYKPNGEIKSRQVYFNLTTKTVINHKFSLANAFQEHWMNEGSSWNVKLIESQYINISTYQEVLMYKYQLN